MLHAKKKPLSNVGGAIEQSGESRWSAVLVHGLQVTPQQGLERLTHGFHTYAARVHPLTAKRLIEGLSAPGDVVLDPFCGSGTVLTEANVAGRVGVGRDINPLAVRLAALRSGKTSQRQRAALRELTGEVALFAQRRSNAGGEQGGLAPNLTQPVIEGAQVPVVTPWTGPLASRFAPKTLRELSWLTYGVARLSDPWVKQALALVLSSMLVKLSDQQSDTDSRVAAHGAPHSGTIELFRRRSGELSLALKHLSESMKPVRTTKEAGGHASSLVPTRIDDARTLSTIADGAIALIVTSPPYPGVYDYIDHHHIRLAWLGLSSDNFVAGEIGSRRSFQTIDAGLTQWHQDGLAWTQAMARVLRPGGRAAIIGGDGASERGPIRFDTSFLSWAAAANLKFVASASQLRSYYDPVTQRAYRGKHARREHVILVEQVCR